MTALFTAGSTFSAAECGYATIRPARQPPHDAGLAGLVGDKLYVKSANHVFQFDTTTWGWIHLISGAIAFLAGLALFQGAVWARTIGVITLGSALGAFAWLPIYPFWAFNVIAVDIAVIWVLTRHGRDITMED